MDVRLGSKYISSKYLNTFAPSFSKFFRSKSIFHTQLPKCIKKFWKSLGDWN